MTNWVYTLQHNIENSALKTFQFLARVASLKKLVIAFNKLKPRPLGEVLLLIGRQETKERKIRKKENKECWTVVLSGCFALFKGVFVKKRFLTIWWILP